MDKNKKSSKIPKGYTQKPRTEEQQTIHWPKEKNKKDEQLSTTQTTEE